MYSELVIDNNTYPANNNSYIAAKKTKQHIVITNSNRKDSNYIKHLINRTNYSVTDMPCFTISREGKVYQHFDSRYYSNYIDIDSIDKKAIVIMLENAGKVRYDSRKKMFYTDLNENIASERIILMKQSSVISYYETYPDVQLESLAKLCDLLCSKHMIEDNIIQFDIYNETIAEFEGVIFMSNIYDNPWYRNPTFNIKDFKNLYNKVSSYNNGG